jgi:hypothetical protein
MVVSFLPLIIAVFPPKVNQPTVDWWASRPDLLCIHVDAPMIVPLGD